MFLKVRMLFRQLLYQKLRVLLRLQLRMPFTLRPESAFAVCHCFRRAYDLA